MDWFIIFSIVTGALLAIECTRVADAIKDKKDSSVVSWRLLIACWLVEIFPIVLCIKIAYDEAQVKDERIEKLEERVKHMETWYLEEHVKEIETWHQVDTIYVHKILSDKIEIE